VVETAGAGEPAQHASAHLLLHRGEVFWCQRTSLGEMDLSVLADGEHPVDHAAVEVDMRVQQLKADYKAKYPAAKVLMLELDDGTQIGEAMAICRYVETLHPDPPLLGRDAKERALVEMWEWRTYEHAMLGAAEIFRNSHPAFVDRGLVGYADPVPQVEALVARGRHRLNRFFQMFERQLAEHPFVAGERLSMADITTLCSIGFAQMAKVDILEACTHLRSWPDRISARPSAKY